MMSLLMSFKCVAHKSHNFNALFISLISDQLKKIITGSQLDFKESNKPKHVQYFESYVLESW